jgi:hypothetical protein
MPQSPLSNGSRATSLRMGRATTRQRGRPAGRNVILTQGRWSKEDRTEGDVALIQFADRGDPIVGPSPVSGAPALGPVE